MQGGAILEKLWTGQIEDILDHLPVELSFVGGYDAVMYCSHGNKRIFRRSWW